jgi:hypothetical protein
MYKELYDKHNFKPAICEKYNRDEILEFLESNGVDYVSDEGTNLVTKDEMMKVQDQVNTILIPYLKYFSTTDKLGFTRIIGLQVYIATSILRQRPYTRFVSWKDGLFCYVMRDISKKHFNKDFVIYEPKTNYEKNVYQSSSHLKYTDEEMDILSNLNKRVSEIDLSIPYDSLKRALSKPDKDLSVYDVIISDKELTDGKTFVDVHYCLNNKFSNFGVFRE